MNPVDVADQLRQYYTTKRRHAQTWKPLWYFLLDTAVTNCYLLSSFYEPGQHYLLTRLKFLEQLAAHLMSKCEIYRKNLTTANLRRPTGTNLPDIVYRAPSNKHTRSQSKGKKWGRCKVCEWVGPDGRSVKPRKPLGELQPNSLRRVTTPSVNDSGQRSGLNNVVKSRRWRAPEVVSGYQLCEIPLCNTAKYWDIHIHLATH